MLIAPEGRFIPVNMDRCQDLMGGLFEHVTPVFISLDAFYDGLPVGAKFLLELAERYYVRLLSFPLLSTDIHGAFILPWLR